MSMGKGHLGVYPVTVERLDALPPGRLIAFSDIHGRADLFDAMLAKLALKPEDFLVIVGDLIERGTESLRAVRMAMRLSKRENTRVLMGNIDAHKTWQILSDDPATDENLLFFRKYHDASLFLDMCRELNLPCDTVSDIHAAKPPVREAFAEELRFLAERKTILETPEHIFVHGGLPRADIDSLVGTEAFDCLKFDRFAERGGAFSKRVVVGHWPACLYTGGATDFRPYLQREKNILSIDGGCGLKPDAQLNAVILGKEYPNGYNLVSVDGFPCVTALDAQQERKATFRIGWPDFYVRRVSTDGVFALVEQKEMGLRFLAPETFLHDEEGDASCSDISDYALAVSPGDMLSVIACSDSFTYCKKDGVCGWYNGRYR